MHKQLRDSINISHESFSKTVYSLLFALSLFAIFFGVSGIIEYKSPENLASLVTLSSGFINYIEYHALIVSGALCFVFSACLMRKNCN